MEERKSKSVWDLLGASFQQQLKNQVDQQ